MNDELDEQFINKMVLVVRSFLFGTLELNDSALNGMAFKQRLDFLSDAFIDYLKDIYPRNCLTCRFTKNAWGEVPACDKKGARNYLQVVTNKDFCPLHEYEHEKEKPEQPTDLDEKDLLIL